MRSCLLWVVLSCVLALLVTDDGEAAQLRKRKAFGHQQHINRDRFEGRLERDDKVRSRKEDGRLAKKKKKDDDGQVAKKKKDDDGRAAKKRKKRERHELIRHEDEEDHGHARRGTRVKTYAKKDEKKKEKPPVKKKEKPPVKKKEEPPVKKDAKKEEKPSVKKVADSDKKETKPDEKVAVTETDCVIYVEYDKDPETPSLAKNADLKGSAELLAAATGARIKITSKGPRFPEALKSFTDGGKNCCKHIQIVSHGDGKGALDLPYEQIDKDDPASWGYAKKLGGPGAKLVPVEKFLNEFVDAAKSALCKKETAKITFYGCWSGTDDGIAQQVAARGIRAIGYKGSCPHLTVEEEDAEGNKTTTRLPPPSGEGTVEFPPVKK